MGKVTAALAVGLLAVSVAGVAGAQDAPGAASSDDCLAGGIVVCALPSANGAVPQTPGPQRAMGVITRDTGTEGRYAVRVVSGYFRSNAEVSIVTPQGDFVDRGRVRSIFDEEAYVDAAPGAPTPPAVGFVVLMNYPPGDVPRSLQSSRDARNGVISEAKAEATQIRNEIAQDARRETAARTRYQEELEKLKLETGYYDSYYYTYRYYPYY